MKKLTAWLACFLLLCGISSATKTLTTSVAFTDPQGNVLSAGTINFRLCCAAKLISNGQVVQGLTVSFTLTSGGLMPGGSVIIANDELTPSSTYYIVNIFSSAGEQVRGPENWVLTGSSPIDLSTIVATGPSTPSFPASVLENPSGDQAMTGGFSLTNSGGFIGPITATQSGSNVLINNPSSQQTVSGPQPLVLNNVPFSLTGTSTLTGPSINHRIYVDGTVYTTIQAAHTACLADAACSIVDASGMGNTATVTGSFTVGGAGHPIVLILPVGTTATNSTIHVNGSASSGITCSAPNYSMTIQPCLIKASNGSNLPSVVSLDSNFAFLQFVAVDGNQANNPTSGVGILVNKVARTALFGVTAQNCKTFGIYVSSTQAGNESAAFEWAFLMVINNMMGGIFIQNISDGGLNGGRSEIENNGTPSQNNPTPFTVTMAGCPGACAGTITAGGAISTDASLLNGPLVRIGGTTGCYAQLATTTTTTFTLAAAPANTGWGTCANGAGQQMTIGAGLETMNANGLRFYSFESSGNTNGLLMFCTTGTAGTTNMFGGPGNQVAANFEEAIRVEGTTAAVSCAQALDIQMSVSNSGNLLSGNYNQVVFNNVANSHLSGVFSSVGAPFPYVRPFIDIETVAGKGGNNRIEAMVNGAASYSQPSTSWFINGTSIVDDFMQGVGFAGHLFLGVGGPNLFAFTPGTLSTSRTINISDPGATTSMGLSYNTTSGYYMSKRNVAGCTTGAGLGNQCGTPVTVTLPGSFLDTNYSAGCTPVGQPTNFPGSPYVVAASKTVNTFQITYEAYTAAAASWPNLDCWAIHD